MLVQFTAVSIVLGFYSPYLKNTLEVLTFSSQTRVTSKKRFIHLDCIKDSNVFMHTLCRT